MHQQEFRWLLLRLCGRLSWRFIAQWLWSLLGLSHFLSLKRIILLIIIIHNTYVVSCCVSRTSRQHRRDPWWHWEFVCFREASRSGGTQRRWQDCGDSRLAVKGFLLTLSSGCDWIMYRIFFKSFATFFPRKKHQHCGNEIADADTMAGVQRCQLPQGTLMLSSHSSLAVLVLGWDRTKITKSCKNYRWKVKRLKRW